MRWFTLQALSENGHFSGPEFVRKGRWVKTQTSHLSEKVDSFSILFFSADCLRLKVLGDLIYHETTNAILEWDPIFGYRIYSRHSRFWHSAPLSSLAILRRLRKPLIFSIQMALVSFWQHFFLEVGKGSKTFIQVLGLQSCGRLPKIYHCKKPEMMVINAPFMVMFEEAM